MNERIQSLYTQVCGKEWAYDFDTNKAEQFALLIVRECLYNMENCDGDLDLAIWKTKKDFGVE